MAECIDCGAFTKFDGGRCYPCYQKEKNKIDTSNKEDLEVNGLTDKERNYRYNMIKGRIAETLIQELFLSLGFNVFRYGMENTIPGIMELLKGVKSDVATEIKRMPDFVIQNPNSNEVHFVEVKFRSNGSFALKNLSKDYPYQNALIIVVSKKHIKCVSVEELNDGNEITESSRNYLGNRKEFELNKEVIKEFCDFATKFFEGV